MREVYLAPMVLANMMNKVKEFHLQYYINAFDVVLLRWNNTWVPYLDVMKLDKRLDHAQINLAVLSYRCSQDILLTQAVADTMPVREAISIQLP